MVVGTAAFVAVGFAVPIAEFVPASALEEDEAIGRLGPDVLSPDFDAGEAMARLAASGRPTVAEALLEQRAVAGIGNVFKSELLFLARLWPFVPPADVTEAQWARMMRDARVLLKANVIDPAEAGVLTWRGARRTTGRSNPAQTPLRVRQARPPLPPLRHGDPPAPSRRTQPLDVLVPDVPGGAVERSAWAVNCWEPCKFVLLVTHCHICVWRACEKPGRI